ncbi:unnamed protein product [Candidula unifasciata]|uniref:Uncharacterized protein n=1 Tax=Candidula unifasciata TaxID=100452 RepID=A0A8S3YLM1_9EUPU|nr:unnamed protein product [Candidula unifasciata]
MDLLTTALLVGAIGILVAYFWLHRPNPKCPPSPSGAWPIVGHLLQLTADPRVKFAKFREQCGDVYSLYLGSTRVVVFNGLDVAKEVLVKQGDDFMDRAVNYVDIASDSVNKGLASSNGPAWKEHRLFTMTVLKNFGLGKNMLAEKVQEEVNYFMELLESFQGKPKDVDSLTTTAVSNIMCSIIVGRRFDYDDQQFAQILELIRYNLSKLKGTALLNYFPWLRFLPGDLFYCKIITKNFREFFDIFARYYIQENEQVVGEPGNYIAAYLQEINKKVQAGEKTYLDKSNLLRCIFDLFVAGTETTATTLGWFFLYMVNYPRVQDKVFEEISEVVGQDRAPNTQDRSKLVYTTATIMEVQRLASLLPFSGARVVRRDVQIAGYLIPQDSHVLINFDTVLHDKALWGDDADQFRPERFIASDGSLYTPDAWIPFAIGKRNCLGDSMAKLELYIFVSNIIQRFQILPPDSKRVPPLKGCLQITHVPSPYEVRFVSRTSRL